LSRGGEKRWEALGRLQGLSSQEHFWTAVAEILDEIVAGLSFYQVIAHRRRLPVFEEEINSVGVGDAPEMAIVKNKELGMASGGSFDGIRKRAVFIKNDAVVLDRIFIPGQVCYCAPVENDVFLTVDKMLDAVTGGEKDGA
jgi:hypothetical protein